MRNSKQEHKSVYNLMPVFIRGDRNYIDTLKAKAALAHMPLADYLRKSADYAIANGDAIFFDESGSDVNRNGNG